MPPYPTGAARMAAAETFDMLNTAAEPQFDAVCRIAAHIFRAPIAIIPLVVETRLLFKARFGLDVDSCEREASFCDLTIRGGRGRVLVVPDLAQDPRFAESPLVRGPPHARFYAGVALGLDAGSCVGTICVMDRAPRFDFTDEQVAQLKDLAQIVEAHLRLRDARLASEREIERRRRVEALLTEREARLRAAHTARAMAERTACFGHWSIDLADGTVQWSDGISRIFDRNPSLKPLSLAEHLSFYHPEDRLTLHGRLLAAAADPGHAEIAYEHRSRILRPSGEERIVSVHGVIERDDAGQVTTLHGVCLDVTDHVHAERQQRETLELLRTTLETMDQGLLMIGPDDRIGVLNRRAHDLLGLPDDVLHEGASYTEVRDHQARAGEFARASTELRRCLETESLQSTPFVYERERPNGLILEVRSAPLSTGGQVRTFTDITDRKRREAVIEHMARHDALTGLPNRRLFHETLGQELAKIGSGGEVAVLCCDLDRFKAVNDTFGHSAGDALLRELARRLLAVLREEDLVARLGGDEFAIILPIQGRSDLARTVAARAIEAVGQPLEIEGHLTNVGLSIGIAVAPRDGAEPEQLFKNADIALYRAKEAGRNTFRFYEPALDAQIVARNFLELDLREAVHSGGMTLRYQPIFDLATGRLCGFEALLRWFHPRRGMISPAEFIPLAEETGLIVSIGEWVLREASSEAVDWPSDLRVAVNVSSIQLRRPGLEQAVLGALAASGLQPGRLELEITESAMLVDADGVFACLGRLRGMGVHIALDDFGTGFSSLSHLTHFLFDKIKIDCSFVRRIDEPISAAVVRAVTGLGAQLHATVTAEGVETAEQLNRVRQAGCTQVQGYLYGGPMTASEARAFIQAGASARGDAQAARFGPRPAPASAEPASVLAGARRLPSHARQAASPSEREPERVDAPGP